MAADSYHERLWDLVEPGSGPPRLRERLAFVLEHVDARGAARIADVGCGEGQIAERLAAAGALVTGLDVAREPLRRARERCPDLDLRLFAPDGPWPLEDVSVDAVWAGEVIEHVLDTATWLSEARRVLRSGGPLLLSTPGHGPLWRLGLALVPGAFERSFDPRSDHVRFYTARSIATLLREFGFQDVRVRGLGGPPGARRTLLVSAIRSRF